MKASLQQKIAPFSPTQPSKNFSTQNKNQKDDGAAPKVDFKKLLLESNAEEQKRMTDKKNGDLSSAENYEDFLRQLNEQTTQRAAPKTTLGKDDFMKLFVTQLQHQDPLNPKDGAEMAAQLAQFNGLEQMQNVNSAIETLQNISTQSNNMNMMQYIGKEIDGHNGLVKWNGDNTTPAHFSIETAAQNVELSVKDSSGKSVRTIPLGAFEKGDHAIHWDGIKDDKQLATSGMYSLELSSKDNQGQKQKIPVKTRLKIQGIDTSEESYKLKTDVGSIDGASIKEVRAPKDMSIKQKPKTPFNPHNQIKNAISQHQTKA
ncbi:MAG: flagellar hook assembly protein FlgD [Oligoflexales bacterium]